MENDVLLSDDLSLLRFEIVRLRSLVDTEFRVAESYRSQCERLYQIINQLTCHEYGKS